MPIVLSLSSATLTSGDILSFQPKMVTVIVGPNNSGKTTMLRELRRNLVSPKPGTLIQKIDFTKDGSYAELENWLDSRVALVQEPKRGFGPAYSWLGVDCPTQEAKHAWNWGELGKLVGLLTAMLDVETRLDVVKPPEPIDHVLEAPAHPLHVLQKDDGLEETVSRHFRMAFGSDLTLNRGIGKFTPLHCGERPDLGPSHDRVSQDYVRRLLALPLLHEQGHGMRSFTGCVLHTITTPALIEFIDEPEAFLHPPQARLFGTLLTREKPPERQLFIATHSGDLLRGVLDTNEPKLQVVRLSRTANTTSVHVLDTAEIRKVWSDPILRFSNVLDGLFHDAVVVTESDSDCRFYAAVMDAVVGDSVFRPDVMFSNSGGKQRLPVIARALRSLGVKTRVVADFDVLREMTDMKGIVESLGGDWGSLEPFWRVLKSVIEQRRPPLSRHQVKERIDSYIDGLAGANLSDQGIEEIRDILKSGSAWQTLKLAGLSALPSGEARASADTLFERLRAIGFFIVELGEIERFVPSVGGHGPLWVSRPLERDLARDPELESSRRFVSGIIGVSSGPPRAPQPIADIDPVNRGAMPLQREKTRTALCRLIRLILRKK